MSEEKTELVKVNHNNITWQKNHAIILKSFEKLYVDADTFPTLQQISDDCGLSWTTVQKHCARITLDDVTPKYKLAADRVIKKLLKTIDTDAKAAEVKLFNQLVMGYREKNEIVGKDDKELIVNVNLVKK